MVDPKATGRAAVHSFRRGVVKRIVESLRERDPDVLAGLTDAGIVSREFVDEPDAGGPVRTAPPLEVVERLLERSIERKPSLIAGLHMGDVVVTRDDVVGHVVNVAARVTESAKGGEVIVTGDVRDAVVADLPRVNFTRARRKTFKGLVEPIPVSKATYSA